MSFNILITLDYDYSRIQPAPIFVISVIGHFLPKEVSNKLQIKLVWVWHYFYIVTLRKKWHIIEFKHRTIDQNIFFDDTCHIFWSCLHWFKIYIGLFHIVIKIQVFKCHIISFIGSSWETRVNKQEGKCRINEFSMHVDYFLWLNVHNCQLNSENWSCFIHLIRMKIKSPIALRCKSDIR